MTKHITVTVIPTNVSDMKIAFAVPMSDDDANDFISTYEALCPQSFDADTKLTEHGAYVRKLSGETADGRRIEIAFVLNDEESFEYRQEQRGEKIYA